jgi:hypothetical protein
MNDYDYYNRQMALYDEVRSALVTRLGRELMLMSQEYIVIHRPDKLSPKKRLERMRFGVTK